MFSSNAYSWPDQLFTKKSTLAGGGFSAPACEIPRSIPDLDAKFLAVGTLRYWPWSCCGKWTAITMSRLSVLAIIVTLAVGPNASILCRAWCAGDNLPQECHQQLAPATVAAADCCDGPVTNVNAFRSGEARQDTVAPSQGPVAAQHHIVVSAGSVRLSQRHEPRGSNESRLVTVLRI